MLRRKLREPIAPISRDTERAEEALFHRLQEHARNRPLQLDCTVQQVGDSDFVTVLSDPDSGREICAWSGAADGIIVEFEAWLERTLGKHHYVTP